MDQQDSPTDKYSRFDADDETVHQLIRQGHEAISSFLEVEDSTKINQVQPNGYTLLQIAVYEGNKDLVQFLLDQGADIHLRAYSDETALHLACDRGHEDIVKMLFKRRSQVKQKDDCWGNTALHFAARGGNENIVKLILAQDLLDINIVNKYEKTALHLASEEGHVNIVKLLLTRRANIHAEVHYNGYTVLQAAVSGKSKSIVEFLLDSGIDINKRKTFEKSLILACDSGQVDIVKLLLERGPSIDVEDLYFIKRLRSSAKDKSVFEFLVNFAVNVFIPSGMRMTVLHLASEGGKDEIIKSFVKSSSKNLLNNADAENEKIVKLLIDCGIDLISTKVFNESLSLACEYGYEDVVRKLFDRVPKAEIKEKLDKKILIDAAKGGNTNVFQLILDQVVDINVRCGMEKTALHFACERGHQEIVKLLIDRGADVKVKDCLSFTPLHFAAEGGNIAIFKLLFDLGVDVNWKNFYDETALHVVCKKGHEDLLKVLFECDKKIDMEARAWPTCHKCTALHFAAQGGNKYIVKSLLDQGFEIDATNNRGESVLHVACERGSEDVVELLVERGANVKFGGDKEGKTVLHSAVSGGNENIVKLLLDRGVDLHSRDSDGTSALLLAVQLGNLEITELLIKYGAKTTDKDNQGYSVYHMVAKHLRPKSQACDVQKECVERIVVSSVTKINGIVKFFSNLGVNINSKDNEGDTPLHTVNRDVCNFEMVKLFLNYGADIFAKNNKGETALKLACDLGLVSTAKLLLDVGADIESKDKRGVTIFGSLTEIGFRDGKIVKLLLNYGVDLNVRDESKRPALWSAIGGSKKLIELFLDYGASVGSRALSLAIERKESTAAQLLLDYGAADIDFEDARLSGIIEAVIRKCKDPYKSDDESEFEDCKSANNDSGHLDCASIITRHVVKLMANGEDVAEKILEYINGNRVMKNFKIRCEGEIERMKSDDCCWRIMTSSQHCFASLARNQETMQFLASEECELKYPIYSSFLKNQMRRGIWRRILLDKVKCFFKAVGESEGNEHLPKLPNLCVDRVFSYFSNKDFRNLIKVCDPFDEFDLDLCDIKI